MNNYDDIINLSHYEPKHHKRMDKLSRASQFAPFAALTGYDDAVKETARLTSKKIILDDGLKELINTKLNKINNDIKNNPYIKITYFVKDATKDGGKYITKIGNVKKVDMDNKLIKFNDDKCIKFNDILNIEDDL